MTMQTIIAPHMTPIERELYVAMHREEYRGFTIKPKRDFGQYGYWSSEHRCNVNAGWVVTDGGIINCAPGCAWSWTLLGAREMIDDMISAGIVEPRTHCTPEMASRFWAINRARHKGRKEHE